MGWGREGVEGGTVVVGVSGSNKVCRDCTAEDDAEDTVLTGVGVVFVECDEDEGVLRV